MVLGGGQDASAVTTTDHRAGKFEAKFYDKVNISFIGAELINSPTINITSTSIDGYLF